jgi:hypothetical protein
MKRDHDRTFPADVNFITAYPKSGITFLNYMLFHALFDHPEDLRRIRSDYIIDIHKYLDRVAPRRGGLFYVKSHFGFGPTMPLRDRARCAVLLVRDPIDVMMSTWDYKHLTGEGNLPSLNEADHIAAFHRFVADWISTGGLAYLWADSWLNNVNSWLDQQDIPLLVVRYEALKARPTEELSRIMDFLGLSIAPDRLSAAAASGRVDNMRRMEAQEVTERVEGAFYRGAFAAGYDKGFRFVGRLHQDAYRSVLDDAQRDRVDAVFGPTLSRLRERA